MRKEELLLFFSHEKEREKGVPIMRPLRIFLREGGGEGSATTSWQEKDRKEDDLQRKKVFGKKTIIF